MNRRRFTQSAALAPCFLAQLRTALAEQVNKACLGSIGLQFYTDRQPDMLRLIFDTARSNPRAPSERVRVA